MNETSIGCLLHALHRGQAHRLPPGAWDDTQWTEPHQAGLKLRLQFCFCDLNFLTIIKSEVQISNKNHGSNIFMIAMFIS